MVEFSNTQFLLLNKDKYSILDCNTETNNKTNNESMNETNNKTINE
jgi:hypothetical protein